MIDLIGTLRDLSVTASAVSTDVITTNSAYMHNPLVDQANIVVSQVGLIRSKPSAAPIQIAEITTPGLIKIWRYRKGTDSDWVLIVAGGGMGAGVGSIYYQYTFPSASWEDGDLILYEVYNTVVTLGTEVFTLSTVQGFGVIGDTTQAAAILADTNELQTDWVNGGRLDLILDAITAYGPTNTQMESARDTIITEVNSNETKIDNLDGDLITHNTALTSHEASQVTHRAVLVDIHDTDLPAVKTVADSIAILTDTKVMGRTQVMVHNDDLDSTGTGTYSLMAATGQDVVVEGLVSYCTRDLSGDAGFTGLSVQTDDTTPFTFISQANGVKANLTAESQLSWTGSMVLKVGSYIAFTVYGGDIASQESLWDLIITYRAIVSGGYIA